MMKVVVNAQNDRVVGIHLVGAEVAEILQVQSCHIVQHVVHLLHALDT